MLDEKEIKYDVISIPASGTIDLIYKYGIHAHPDTQPYKYRNTNYITFRKTGGVMEKLFTVQDIIIIKPDNIEEINKLNLDENTKDKLLGYIEERKNTFTFGTRDKPYKFYILKFEKELNHKPKKPRQNNQCYFTLDELESGEEYVNSIVINDKINTVTTNNYWTFFANPKYWYIDDFLNSEKSKEEIYYSIMSIRKSDKDRMKIGDRGVIRVGIDCRTKIQLNGKDKLRAGIYAIVELKSIAEFTIDNDSEFYANRGDAKREKWRVKIKVIKNFINSPIIISGNESDILNKDKYLVKGTQVATMLLPEDAFFEIISLSGQKDNRYTFEEVINEDKYGFCDSRTGIEALNKIYENVDIEKKERIIQVVERGKIAIDFKKYVGFKCQICESMGLDLYSFKKKNGEYYSEAHHIVPVNDALNSKLSVDNLISVCPNHHSQIHFGDVDLISNNDDYIEYKIDGKLVKIEKVKLSTL